MIKFVVTTGQNFIKISVTGHAGQSVFNKDIVCSSVSTLLVTNSNLLYELDDKNNFSLDISDGKYLLVISKVTNNNQIISNNIIYYLRDLTKQYPKFIKEEKND